MKVYLRITRPMVMGVVNVTPDSFSDGGRFSTAAGIDYQACIEQAMEMARQGAGIIDVGGEASSFHRPGVVSVAVEQQLRRVVPVIDGLRQRLDQSADLGVNTILSVDTRCSQVAEAALLAGAGMINDISAGEHDPDMFRVIAAHECLVVLMHQGLETPAFAPVVRENICLDVFGYLQQRAAAAVVAGIAPDHILLDPGIGFGKAPADNWRLLANIHDLVDLGFPVVLGVSRKRFLTDITMESAPETWEARDIATSLVTALAAQRGVAVHRVHNVHLAAMALAVNACLAE
ncbi:MAG: dihydropteroate synthase [Phycisphaerae bacterium]